MFARTIHGSPRWFMLAFVISAALVVGVAVGARQLMAAASASCGPVAAGTIIESKVFTPYEAMRGKPYDGPINAEGRSSDPVPAGAQLTNSIDGRTRQYTLAGSNGAVYSYFLDRPLGKATPSEFLAMGGIQVEQEPVTADGSFAAYLVATLGDRATAVKVGPFDGALTWAEPLANGIRSHNLYWSDGTYNYSVIADRPAEAILAIGRSMVC